MVLVFFSPILQRELLADLRDGFSDFLLGFGPVWLVRLEKLLGLSMDSPGSSDDSWLPQYNWCCADSDAASRETPANGPQQHCGRAQSGWMTRKRGVIAGNDS